MTERILVVNDETGFEPLAMRLAAFWDDYSSMRVQIH